MNDIFRKLYQIFQARHWYEKAASQGHPLAQFNLGILYFNGYGVRQDKVQAKKLFGLACDNGFQTGCDNYKILNN